MNRNLLSLALAFGFATSLVIAQDGKRPTGPENGSSTPRLHLLPRGAEEALNLTEEQRQKLTVLEAESRTKLEAILTPEQVQKLTALRPQPPGAHGNRGQAAPAPSASNDAAPKRPEAEAPAPSLTAGVTRRPVVFSGGHDTVPVDHGRPVILIAAALGVQDEVFREAFSHVHPAGPGKGGPTDTEARANKEALMSRLEKLGVTNDRLNTVSNFYRYAAWEGGIWRNKPATAYALVNEGAITGYEITSGGYGYTTPPAVSIPGMEGATAKVEISYGKDFETNGAIAAITILHSK